MNTRSHVFFWLEVYNPDEISEITRQMGLEPTQIVQGSMTQAEGGVMHFSIWEAASPLPETESVDQHIDALLGLLMERDSVVQELATHHECGIHCQLNCQSTEDQPWQIQVRKRALQNLAQLGLSITFDVFYVGRS